MKTFGYILILLVLAYLAVSYKNIVGVIAICLFSYLLVKVSNKS